MVNFSLKISSFKNFRRRKFGILCPKIVDFFGVRVPLGHGPPEFISDCNISSFKTIQRIVVPQILDISQNQLNCLRTTNAVIIWCTVFILSSNLLLDQNDYYILCIYILLLHDVFFHMFSKQCFLENIFFSLFYEHF